MTEDKRPMNKQMAESMILAKLYKDGLFQVDEEKKEVKVDMRRGRIMELYKEESYDDVKDIMERTVKGLKQAGYLVIVRWLDGASPEEERKLAEIQVMSGEMADDVAKALEGFGPNSLDDGFVKRKN